MRASEIRRECVVAAALLEFKRGDDSVVAALLVRWWDMCWTLVATPLSIIVSVVVVVWLWVWVRRKRSPLIPVTGFEVER